VITDSSNAVLSADTAPATHHASDSRRVVAFSIIVGLMHFTSHSSLPIPVASYVGLGRGQLVRRDGQLVKDENVTPMTGR